MKNTRLLICVIALSAYLGDARADGREGGGRSRQQQQQQQEQEMCGDSALASLGKLNRTLVGGCGSVMLLPEVEIMNHGLDYRIKPISTMAKRVTKRSLLVSKSRVMKEYLQLESYIQALDAEGVSYNEKCVSEAKEIFETETRPKLKRALELCSGLKF
ncbi:MAG TPA: hypothetical protein VNJ01_12240 [Bacteriovoracaceae bacterium]|nr:hypothetical protein [Bacteriovoracaceae bacterium]